MKDELTKEEVRHVADLAKIEISEEELARYQKKLKELLNQVEVVNEIDDDIDEYLIAPWSRHAEFRTDEQQDMLNPQEALENVPRKSGNYIQVPVVITNE